MIKNRMTGIADHSSMCQEDGKDRRIPIYNIRQMTDDEWNRLAYRRQKAEVVS